MSAPAVPPGMSLDDVRRPPPAKAPAKEYKFTLDPFQARARPPTRLEGGGGASDPSAES